MIKSISIILPFYNEEKRLKTTLSNIVKFSNRSKIKFKEFIFVDDGSYDSSFKIVNDFFKKKINTKINYKLIKLPHNLGKGGALKRGVKISNGEWILTSDIDFSVSLFQLNDWERMKYLKKTNKVYFASRSHILSKVNSRYYRRFIGTLLRLIISFFLQIKIRDTQCGFKLYKKEVAKKIFPKIKFCGYEHDLELVLLLKKQKIKIIELPVKWNHVDLSKVNIIYDSIKIFAKIFLIKLKY